MFAALVCIGLWLGFHAPRLAELVPIGVGITAYGAAYALVHDVYIHRRLRWFGDRRVPRPRAARRRPRRAPPLRRGAVRDARAGRAAARVRVSASGSRPSHVPDAAVRLEAGEQLLAVPALGTRAGARRRGGAGDAANARIASTPDHRLNVPSRPTGSSPIPSAASRPSAPASSALTGGPAARNARHARDPHVGAGEHGDRAGRPTPRGEPAEHVDAAPRAVAAERPQADVVALDDAAPRPAVAVRGGGRAPPRRATRRTAPSGAGRPTGRCRRRGRCRAGGGTRGRRRAGAADRSPRRRSAVRRRVVAHEVERRDAGHGTCWHRASAGSGSPCPPVAGLPARLDPDADIVGRRRRRRPARRWATATRAAGTPGRSSGGAPRCRSSSATSPRDRPAPPSGAPSPGRGEWWPAYVGGGAAMVGHAWPLFARFRGGRGVATFGGAAGVVLPPPTAAAVAAGARRRAARRRSPARGHPGRLRRLPARPARRRRAAPHGRHRRADVVHRPALLDGPASGSTRRARPAAVGDGRAGERGDGERRRRAATASRRRPASGVRPRRPDERADARPRAGRRRARRPGAATSAHQRQRLGQGDRRQAGELARPRSRRRAGRASDPSRATPRPPSRTSAPSAGRRRRGSRRRTRPRPAPARGRRPRRCGGRPRRSRRRRAASPPGPPCTGRCRSAGAAGPWSRAPGGAVR